MRLNKLMPRSRFLTGLMSAAVFLACFAGALASFGPPSLRPGSWVSPFTWDAPAQTATRFRAMETDARRSESIRVGQPGGETVILDDWNYTAIVRGRPEPSKHH